MTADGVGTCGADDNQAQAGHLVAFGVGGGADVAHARGASATATGHLDPSVETFIVAPHADPDGHNGRPASRPVLAGIEALAPQGVGDVAAWDPRNVTSGANRTRVEPGLPANTLHSGGQAVIGVGVRRLTPRECERLQGFPDDHTSWGAPTGQKQADGPRYKQLGNAVAVPVIFWLGRRILAAHEA